MSNLNYDPMPKRHHLDAGVVAFLVCLLGLAVSVALLFWIGAGETADALPEAAADAESLPDEAPAPPTKAKITHDSLCATYTHDGEVIRWYVFVDPDYGTQWVYNDHSWEAFERIDSKTGLQVGVKVPTTKADDDDAGE